MIGRGLHQDTAAILPITVTVTQASALAAIARWETGFGMRASVPIAALAALISATGWAAAALPGNGDDLTWHHNVGIYGEPSNHQPRSALRRLPGVAEDSNTNTGMPNASIPENK